MMQQEESFLTHESESITDQSKRQRELQKHIPIKMKRYLMLSAIVFAFLGVVLVILRYDNIVRFQIGLYISNLEIALIMFLISFLSYGIASLKKQHNFTLKIYGLLLVGAMLWV